MISQVYVDLVEDRSRANSCFVTLKALAGSIQGVGVLFPQEGTQGWWRHSDLPTRWHLTWWSLYVRMLSALSALSAVRLGWHHQDLHPFIPVRLHDAPVERNVASKERRWSMNEFAMNIYIYIRTHLSLSIWIWVNVWVAVLRTRELSVNFCGSSAFSKSQVRTTNSSRCTPWWRLNSSMRLLSVHQKAPERPEVVCFHNVSKHSDFSTRQNVSQCNSLQVVLSTNIAEASVTIDDVVYVIDTGVRKERSYDAGDSIWFQTISWDAVFEPRSWRSEPHSVYEASMVPKCSVVTLDI